MENIYESALLPYLEDSLRAGTLLEISKLPAKFKISVQNSSNSSQKSTLSANPDADKQKISPKTNRITAIPNKIP
jgi:hypothetical protein